MGLFETKFSDYFLKMILINHAVQLIVVNVEKTNTFIYLKNRNGKVFSATLKLISKLKFNAFECGLLLCQLRIIVCVQFLKKGNILEQRFIKIYPVVEVVFKSIPFL